MYWLRIAFCMFPPDRRTIPRRAATELQQSFPTVFSAEDQSISLRTGGNLHPCLNCLPLRRGEILARKSIMQSEFHGARFIVTGSSRGIGASIAEALADAGARVVVNYKSNEAAAKTVANGINDRCPGAAVSCQADVRVRGDVRRLVNMCTEAFGGSMVSSTTPIHISSR